MAPQAKAEDQQKHERDARTPVERKAAIQQQRTLRYQERKALGICRDCDEPVASGTIMCLVHAEKMRAYRQQYKAKKRAEAKKAKAE